MDKMLYNNHLMEDIEHFKKKFSILQDISNAIVATDNISTIANLMLDLAVNYSNAEKGSLMLLNELGELYILAAKGIDIHLKATYKVKIGEGIAGAVAKSRQPVLIEDIEEDERFKEKKRDRYKTQSFISCPIMSKNKLLGVLNINDKKDGTPFTEDEFELMKNISNQAAIVLENALLMNQLKVKASELEEINRKLIDSDIVKTEFLTRVSHELRTPLNAIKGSIYHLQQSEKLTRIEQNDFYDIVSKETGSLISIVENLLDFLRLEDEIKVIKKSVISLEDLLNEILNLKSLKTTLERKNIQLKTDVKKGVSDIVGDRVRVVQFFINLLEGLSLYLARGDTIGIHVAENNFVEVSLTLPRSLPVKIAPLIFNSGHIFQEDQPEEKLKLYLARKIAEIHRWNLHAENRDDTFIVSLAIPKSSRDKIEAVMDTTMGMFIDFIAELLNLNICSIMVSDEFTGDLTIKSAKGLDENVIKRTRIGFGEKIAGWVALEGKPLLIENIESDTRFGRKSIPKYNTKSLISLPLKIENKVIGVLNLNNKKTGDTFTLRDFYIATVIGERLSHFIERLYTGECTEGDLKNFVTSFDNLLNAERRYHKKNTLLPDLLFQLMEQLERKEAEKRTALYVSMIYDLGLALVDELVMKKKKLSQSEVRTVKLHPYTTINLLNNFEFAEDVKKAILHHHEQYDGKGYPDGLKGEEIPFISRVLSVVDAFHAMITERPYRKKLTKDEAMEEIKKGSGTVYDPGVVKGLEKVLQ